MTGHITFSKFSKMCSDPSKISLSVLWPNKFLEKCVVTQQIFEPLLSNRILAIFSHFGHIFGPLGPILRILPHVWKYGAVWEKMWTLQIKCGILATMSTKLLRPPISKKLGSLQILPSINGFPTCPTTLDKNLNISIF